MQFNWDRGFGIVHIDFPHLLIFQLPKYQQRRIFSSTRNGFKIALGDPIITIKKLTRPWLTQKQKKA
jgi:hypothetical protein